MNVFQFLQHHYNNKQITKFSYCSSTFASTLYGVYITLVIYEDRPRISQQSQSL